MIAFIAKRLLLLPVTVTFLTIVTFYAIHLVPGDIVDVLVGQSESSPQQVAQLRRLFGIGAPIHERYLAWLGDVARGDWGVSLRTHRPVLQTILDRLPLTAHVTMLSLAFALAIGLPAGAIAGTRRDTVWDTVARGVALIGLSVPHFVMATVTILALSVGFGWLPPVGFVPMWVDPVNSFMVCLFPAIALGASAAADTMRMLRASLVEVYQQEYVRVARAKGLANGVVSRRHALPNAIIPVVTVVAVRVGYLLAGSVVVEEIFSLPGMGRLLLNAVFQRDYPVLQGCVLVLAAVFVLTNLVADVLYAVIDPRIRYG